MLCYLLIGCGVGRKGGRGGTAGRDKQSIACGPARPKVCRVRVEEVLGCMSLEVGPAVNVHAYNGSNSV